MKVRHHLFWAAVLLGGVYLFATRPVPLETSINTTQDRATIPTAIAFDTLDQINAAARDLYTSRIVGNGLKAGLKFGEDWARPDRDKGPLPALFLRLVAAQIEARPPRLGLYLGSDQPINKSNLFEGADAVAFQSLRLSGQAIVSFEPESGAIGLYPDFANAMACVTCHNEHKGSPKTDWKQGDIMGATTWTYPRKTISRSEYHSLVEVLFVAIGQSYQGYLDKTATFENPPDIGTNWPLKDQYTLPDRPTFMAELRAATALNVLTGFVLFDEESDD